MFRFSHHIPKRLVLWVAAGAVLIGGVAIRGAAAEESVWMPAFTYEKKATWNETFAASLAASSVTAPVAGDWFIIGPFDNFGGQGFDTEYPPEEEINLDEAYQGKNGRLVRWIPGNKIVDGKVNDLAALFDEKNDAVVYLYRTIYSPVDQEVVASFGSDDTLTVWVNGLKSLSKNVSRAAAPDQDRLKLDLREGENELLVKVCQGSGEWAFYFALKTRLPSAVESPLLQRLIRDFPADPKVDAAYRRLYEIRRARWKDYALPQLDVLGVNVRDFGASGVGEGTNGNIDAGARVITNVGDTSTFQAGHGIYLWHYRPVDGLAAIDAGAADLVASVRVRPQPGSNPSEPGLAFRVADADNYWALSAAFQSADAPRATLRLLRVRDGESTELRAKDLERPSSPTAALSLKVVLSGQNVQALVNDRALFELTDGFGAGSTQVGLYQNARHLAASPLFLEFRVGSQIEDRFDRPNNPYNLGSAPTGHRWVSWAGRWGILSGAARRTEGATGESLASTVVRVGEREITIADPWPGEDNALVDLLHDDIAALERALRVGSGANGQRAPHLILPEGSYNISRSLRLTSPARLTGLAAERGMGASIQALPGMAPEYEDERFILFWQYANREGASLNTRQSLENLRLTAIFPQTNPGLSGLRLATGTGSRYSDLAVDAPRRGIVVAGGSANSTFGAIDVRAGETGIDLEGRGAHSLTFQNIRLAPFDSGVDTVGLRIGPQTAGVVAQGIGCVDVVRPVVVQGGRDITLHGLNASALSCHPVVDLERARDDLSLTVSGTARGFMKAVSVAGETVAWAATPADESESGARPFRFVGGQSSLWMTGSGESGQVNFLDHIRPAREISGGESLVIDLIDTRTRGGGSAIYEYVVSTGGTNPTVEVGTLTVLHNFTDFQLLRTVKGRVGPGSADSLFTPDADMRDGLLSLRIRADVTDDRAIRFNAVKTGLGLPGPVPVGERPPDPTIPSVRAASRPGADGYIRDWLAIGPVPYKGDTPRGVLTADDLNGESKVSPRPGDRTVIRGETLQWRPVRSEDPILDLSRTFRPGQWDEIERSFGYLVGYLEADREIPNLTMRLDFDDAVRVWLNGKEVRYDRDGLAVGGNGNAGYRLFDPAAGEKVLKYHGVKNGLTLDEGPNTLVLKTCNEAGRWAVGVRFTDLDGRPVSRYRVATSPDAF